jgi:hypothetical protein
MRLTAKNMDPCLVPYSRREVAEDSPTDNFPVRLCINFEAPAGPTVESPFRFERISASGPSTTSSFLGCFVRPQSTTCWLAISNPNNAAAPNWAPSVQWKKYL